MGRGQELLNAAREGDKRTVEKILGQITNISGPFTSFKNILQVGKSRAVELDNKQDSKLEKPEDPNGLRRGAGVNVQDDNGYTPLHQACLNGHKDIVRVLLSVGASPCIVDKKGATPLHLAAFNGDTDVCWMLLAHNNPPCNVDQLTADHETALLIAAQFGYINVVAQLIIRGADVTIKNNNDESALDLAAQYGRLEVVKHLLEVRPHLVDQYRHPACRNVVFPSTPLHRASMNGRKDVVKALIDAGMDPNVRSGPNSGTPLHEAARFGKPSVVRILLNKGADLHAQDSNRKTVYDLLAEYPEEATRKVRKVIREYENIMGNFDSDKELPPFPVQDYSPDAVMSCSDIPTAKMLNPKSNASPELGTERKGNLYVINAFNPIPSPEARIKNQVLPNKHNVNSTLSVDLRERTDSFLNKANNKQFKTLGNGIASDACPELFDKIISEFKSRNISKAGPDSEKEAHAVEHMARNLVDSNEKIRESTVGTNSIYVNDLKKRPQPPSKPTAYVSRFVDEPDEDDGDAIYVNECVTKNNNYAAKNYEYSAKNNDYAAKNNDYAANNNDYAAENSDYSDRNNDYEKENIYENVNIKSKLSLDVVDTMNAATNDYVSMNSNSRFHRSATFTGTLIKPGKFSESLQDNKDDCVNSNGYPEDYVTMNAIGQNDRPLSVQLNKTDLVHLRGNIGCIYEPTDYSYIYEIHPGACHGKPFTKTKQKAEPQPCYCHEDPDREAKIQRKLTTASRPIGGSQNIYFSCEDMYVAMKNKEGIYSSLNNVRYDYVSINKDENKEETCLEDETKFYKFDGSDFNQSNEEKSSTLDAKSVSIVKKKLMLMKQLFVEW
ncbi:hypothetical protein PYW08_006420 [Mythimna loreyi]|uniref:Uncharacterized protein n=1 Tax=Mythimna loreyi TaxID=667449 RepID=A0ACC2QMM9_9NEOP|nr:hypothetical protein PYW08_006420 [Mythimna loreyi]